MILPLSKINSQIRFSANEGEDKKQGYSHDTLLPNNLVTNTKIGVDKFTNAMTVYPAKGLKGSKNANFYEFLTMGMIPYLTGSLTLMAVFNAANKYYAPFQKMKASQVGNKLALGVLFYGILKNVSKSFISKPVQMLTGVDIEQPYAKVIYELPDNINDTDVTSIEHHKVFESVEFPRWDLLYGDEAKGEKRNVKYDKIAKKMGLGDNLNDSDQEVKPKIKELVIRANLAKNFSSYLWAATGVALAFQKPWENFFRVMTFKFWKGKDFVKSIKSFGNNFVESAKALYKGEGHGMQKHAGKLLLGAAALSSIVGVLGTVFGSSKPQKHSDNINKEERYVVS